MTKHTRIARFWAGTAFQALGFLAAAAIFYLITGVCGCRATADSVKLIDGDFVAPELQDFEPLDARSLTLHFSKPVDVASILVTDAASGEVKAKAERLPTEDLAEVSLALSEATELGSRYLLCGVVNDLGGNSLDFSLAFQGFNEEVPRLLLSEVRSEKSDHKVEYIELYTLSSGNLAGVTLTSANYGSAKNFEFPPCEVAAGEYIVVHYRTVASTKDSAPNMVDELSANLLESTGGDSSPGRDFWVPGNEKLVTKSDVVILRARAGGTIVDGLCTFDDTTKVEWKNETIAAAATELSNNGFWPDGFEPSAAVTATKATNTRTISRQNIATFADTEKTAATADQRGKDAWLLTDTSTATPGLANSAKPYVEKPPTTAVKSSKKG
jgi:hypothetical protein